MRLSALAKKETATLLVILQLLMFIILTYLLYNRRFYTSYSFLIDEFHSVVLF